MKLSKEQFIELVIALEYRNITIGLEGSAEWVDEELDEVPPAISEKIKQLEKLQHEVYSTASEYGLEEQFEIHEDTKLLVVKQGTELEQIVWGSVEEMEKAVTYEVIVRQKTIELSQKIKQAKAPEEPKPEELFPKIEEIANRYWKQLDKKGLEGLIKDIE